MKVQISGKLIELGKDNKKSYLESIGVKLVPQVNYLESIGVKLALQMSYLESIGVSLHSPISMVA